MDVEAVVAVLERGWTKGTMARDAAGHPCNPRSDSAVCWCLLGAIERVYKVMPHSMPAVRNLNAKWAGVARFNDAQPTLESLVAMFRRAFPNAQS